jgi:hypothetical protein
MGKGVIRDTALYGEITESKNLGVERIYMAQNMDHGRLVRKGNER